LVKALFYSYAIIVTVLSKGFYLTYELLIIRLFLSLDFSKVKLQRDQDINVGANFHIAVVSPTELLACDYRSKTVSLVDNIVGGVVAKVSVPGRPRRICVLSEGKSAVTLEGKKVQFLKVGRGTLTIDNVLELDNEVYGISSLNNNLVLSFSSPSGIEIMSLEGKVICTIDNDKAGRKVFHKSINLTNSKDGHIYASDMNSNTVMKLDNRLVVIKTYIDTSLQSPSSIISISRDHLLVCSENNNRVVLLNTRTGNTTVLLGAQDGLKWPYALTYCHTQRKLFAASCDGSKIQIYKIV